MNDHSGNSTLVENLVRLKASDETIARAAGWQCRQVEVRVQADGSPSLKIDGHPLYPEANTLQIVAQQSAGLLQNQKADLIVFFGFGLGLHLEFLRRLSEAPIVVFEPDTNVLVGVLEKLPLQLEEVVLVTEINELVDVVQSYLGRATAKMVVGAMPSWVQLQAAQFEKFKEAIQQVAMLMAVDRNTRSMFTEEWITNIAANLPFLGSRNSWDVLGERFAGKPAILVGAGPSLDRNIKDLARARDKALIVATHSAVKPLVKAGIIPDLVAIVESQKLDYYFEDVEYLGEMVLLASPLTHWSHMGVGFKGFLGLSLEGNVAADWLRLAYGEKPQRSGGSVACAAFSVMHGLNCDPLIFVGMDLAYSGNRSHAGESLAGCCDFELDSEKKNLTRICRLGVHEKINVPFERAPAWGGNGEVLAHPVYSQFRHWFEAAVRSWVGPRQLINATEGGARISGFQEMSMAKAVDDFCVETMPVKEMISSGMERAEPRNPAILGKVVGDEMEVVSQAAKVATEAKKTAKQALKLLRSGQLNRVQPLLDKLAGQERGLQEFTRSTLLLNSMVGLDIQKLASETATGDEVAKTIHSLEQSSKISELVIKGSEQLINWFGPALKEMEEKA